MPPVSRFSTAERLRQRFRVEHGERLAVRAKTSGLVTEAQLDEAREASEADGRPLTAVLLDRGWLDATALARLEETEAREEFSRPSTTRPAVLPAEVEEAAANPDRNLDEFVLVAPLGRGGAGEVWKSWDRRLGRWVAVKISTASLESTSAQQRFEREAMATARLAHPNIVPIFQVGTAHGRSFLVMPHIDGQTLERASLPLRQALEVMHTVALAVEHAHQQGIVHRDLKPGNIMITPQAGGVFVLDFGLAYLREETSSRLTRPGEVVGTASYMAPEQARGDHTAPATAIDVYGLGATLYALVAGRAPFTGDSFAAVVARVMTADPEPPRRLRPDLDARVEAVVLKAMDKNPRHRYPSAAAFADDLRRVLDDRKVEARTAHVQRLHQWLRRHAPLWAAVAVICVALAVAGLARFGAGHERDAAVETLREMARLSLESALRLRRAGDTVGMRKVLPQLVAAYQRVEERGAASAEVDYLMGRMYRALLDEDKALAHQERALAKDATFASALYERSVLLSRRYGRDLNQTIADLQVERPKGSKPADAETAERARPALAQLRARIVEDWTRLTSLTPSPAQTYAARGILAFYRSRPKEARDLLAQAVAADPLMEEAWDALALAHSAARNNAEADLTYTRALALDRGYAPHLVGRCDIRRLRGRTAEAVADATAALVLDPASIGARLCRATIGINRSHDEIMSGADALQTLNTADQDFSEVLRRRETTEALYGRALVRRYRAIFLDRRGKDPLPDFAAAEADCTRAITLDARDPERWSARGRVRTRRALHDIQNDRDATADLDAAQADFDEALRLDPTRSSALMWTADVQTYRGLQALRQGQPSEPFFVAAEARYTRAERAGADAWLHLLRGTMLTWRGVATARAGGDPLAVWTAAEDDLERALKAFPRYHDSVVRRGILRLERARHLVRDRRAARIAHDLGVADLEHALAREPDHREARAALAIEGDPVLSH